MRANRDEPDPRRRSVIPAYSGVRGSPDLKANSIALDGSSLIIIASLDLIELVTARWIVTIAHSTLGWLFGERQRLAFHTTRNRKIVSLGKRGSERVDTGGRGYI